MPIISPYLDTFTVTNTTRHPIGLGDLVNVCIPPYTALDLLQQPKVTKDKINRSNHLLIALNSGMLKHVKGKSLSEKSRNEKLLSIPDELQINEESGLNADGAGGGGSGTLTSEIGDAYLEFGDITAPSNPAVGSTRLFLDTSTGELSVRTSSGTTVSLEAAAAGGGSLEFKELDATGQSAGNLNLTDSDWGISKSKVDYIKITATAGATSFDIAFYESDAFAASEIRYSAEGILPADGWNDDLEWSYIDRDSTNEIHLKITETGGTSTYAVHVRGVELT